MKSPSSFSRRGPDRVSEELATVLSGETSFEFKSLFTIVHANLKARNAVSGGEEMLRLRIYEKLQNLVQAGVVNKTGKEYSRVAAPLANYIKTSTAMIAEIDERLNGLRRQQQVKPYLSMVGATFKLLVSFPKKFIESIGEAFGKQLADKAMGG
jgi:hypothetical protein